MSVGLLGAVLFFSGLSPLFMGALGAVAPDFENLLWKTGLIGDHQKIFPTHSGLIRHGRTLAGGGLITELTMFGASLGMVVLAFMIRGGGV
jgi:hypothetical protein